jgi:hypothetical protein
MMELPHLTPRREYIEAHEYSLNVRASVNLDQRSIIAVFPRALTLVLFASF